MVSLVESVLREQERLPTRDRKRMLLIADEFQTITGADWGSMFAEIRKYGCSMMLTTQSLARLDGGDRRLKEGVLGNVGLIIGYQMSADDARIVAPEMDSSRIEERNLVNLYPHHCYMRINTDRKCYPVFSMTTLAPPEEAKGSEESKELVLEKMSAYTSDWSEAREKLMAEVDRRLEISGKVGMGLSAKEKSHYDQAMSAGGGGGRVVPAVAEPAAPAAAVPAAAGSGVAGRSAPDGGRGDDEELTELDRMYLATSDDDPEGTPPVVRRTSANGGLAGHNYGTIRSSYSSASVDGGGVAGSGVGGLVGSMSSATIIASYAAGPVSGTGTGAIIGGFVATVSSAGSAITDSYCDTGATGQANCIGTQSGGAAVAAAGHSSTTLQTPTAYTGIYANWNIDLNGDTFPDNPWNFGATTYPALKTPTQRQAAPAIDYDSNNNNLIDVDSVYKLNAIRHDLNGDGLPDAVGNYPAYAGAFPDGDLATTTPNAPRMGCPATCTGYELTGNINFAADGIAVTGTDPYPNWTPIGPAYAAVFDGKGNTINHLTITGATGNSGLFNTLTTGAVIRDVGMLAASIGNNGADAYVGVLAGDNDGGMIITSYASGGAVTITGTSTYAGGLIGRNAGDLRAVYSTASVTAGGAATSTIGGLIGLHAGSVQASYAAGTTTGSAAAIVGGFAGAASSTAAAITNGYCDTDATTQSNCIGAQTAGATATSTGYTTTDLQTPTGYTGIYLNWNIPLGAANMLDDPWDFGASGEYPTIKAAAQRVSTTPPPPPIPPPPPDQTPTPTSTPATSTDPVPGDGNGNGETATSTDPVPGDGNGNGETATSTDPVPGDGGNGGSATSTDTLPPAPTPAPTPEPTDSGDGRTGTSTDTLPPPLPRTIPTEPDLPYNPAHDHPEIYNNAEYEMAATCQTHNIDPETGNPQAATVTFDLGTYTGPILLHLSIWRNGRYMAYETQGIALSTLEREGQRATLRVDTDPTQTRFRLDGRRHGLAANLLLGYANCQINDP